MRREDIFLRDAAKRGEPSACLEMARRLFGGEAGLPRNHKLGLAYLQQELQRGSRAAIELVGDQVPLEILMLHDCRGVLERATEAGSTAARIKLGVWRTLARTERTEGIAQVRAFAGELADLGRAPQLARLLREKCATATMDPFEVFARGAERALQLSNLDDAQFCLDGARAVWTGARTHPRLDAIVAAVVMLAARTGGHLSLPVDVVEPSLNARVGLGDEELLFALGCALAGSSFGRLDWSQVVARQDLKRATALLLRAADRGKSEAWLRLSEIMSMSRNSVRNREAARFFLEKAAHAGVVAGQRILGALLLKEADSLPKAEQGVHWLSKAAECGDGAALVLLKTLVLPLPSLSPTLEVSIVERVRAVDGELAARLALARAFHLTRREAMNFDARRDVRTWGILVPGTYTENPKGRLVPAVHESMRAELRRAVSFFGTSVRTGASQVGRMQRQVFESLSVPEERFFAPEIGRSWSHYGFGRHWAARARPLLKEFLPELEGSPDDAAAARQSQ